MLKANTQAKVDLEIAQLGNISADVRRRIGTVKLGDEITINGAAHSGPDSRFAISFSSALNDTTFQHWCTAHNVTLARLLCPSRIAPLFTRSMSAAMAVGVVVVVVVVVGVVEAVVVGVVEAEVVGSASGRW